MIHKRLFGFVILGVILLIGLLVGLWLATNRSENPNQTHDYLVINEWQVKIPLTARISDAYYTYNQKDKTVTVSTHALDQLVASVHGCRSGLTPPTYQRLRAGDHYVESGATFDPARARGFYHVGGYYIGEVHFAVALCVAPASDTADQILRILQVLREQMAKIGEK